MASTPKQESPVGRWTITPTPGQNTLRFSAPYRREGAVAFHGVIGRSPGMRRVVEQMQLLAPCLVTATIEGEDGTGKSLVARALHAGGPASGRLFVPCLASLFFAQSQTPDFPRSSTELLAKARDGMLYLDRVHELDHAQQALLSNFLIWFEDGHTLAAQTGTHSIQDHPAPRQIVFSSSVPLHRLLMSSSLRHDLAARLSTIRLLLPPLHERREDIPMLAQLFIHRFSRTYHKEVRGLGPGTIASLLRHTWPGNIRELESVITSAAHQTESQWIRPIDLPCLAPGPAASTNGACVPAGAANAVSELNLDRAIRDHVNRTLQRTRGNKLRAAQLLGISRSTLYRILAGEQSVPTEAL